MREAVETMVNLRTGGPEDTRNLWRDFEVTLTGYRATARRQCHLPCTFAHPERIELPVGIAVTRVMESQHLEDGAAVAQARASMMLLPYLCAIRIRLRGSRDLDASKACLATSRR